MKVNLSLSMLAVGLIGATPSFAQSSTSGPTYPYPQGYEETGPSGSAHSFGPSDYGFEQGRVITSGRARNHVPRKQ